MAKEGLPERAENGADKASPAADAGRDTGADKASPAADAGRDTGMISMRRINQILFAIALIALLAMLRGIDWASLLHSFSQLGASWPLLFIPYGFSCCFWTVSWHFLLVDEEKRPPLHRLFFLRLGGDSLNQLTPTASLGGEPFKAVRLQAGGIPWQKATASLVIHKALMVLSLVLYIFIAFIVIPVALPGISHRLAVFTSTGTVVLGTVGLVFLTLQRCNPCTSFLKVLKRVGSCPAFLAAKEAELASLDATLGSFYRTHPWSVMAALLFFLLGWLAQTVEVFVIFRLLGHPIDLTVALCLDALAQLVAALGFMIPASLGVQDGGNVMLSLGFNLGATLGAGFSILRRFREAFWLLIGLLVLAWEK